MRPLIVLVSLPLLATAARADDDGWPADRDARITAQIAACEGDQPAICFEVAGAMDSLHIATRLGHTPADLRAHGEATLAAQCTAGHADACAAHGRFLAAHGDSGADAELERGCDLGDASACVERAAHARPGARAPLLMRACELGDGAACEAIAATTRDPARALALHRKACDGGDAHGCAHAGAHDRAAGDRARAFGEFSSACDLAIDGRFHGDDVAACDDAGALADDAAKARELFQRACDADYPLACEHLGERIARGLGGARDWGAGLAMIADGCARAGDHACRALASVKAHPPDPRCDTTDACEALCQEQIWGACRRLVELQGPDPETNEWLENACNDHDARGCVMRGDMSDAFTDALPWYRRGCALHDATACGYVAFDRARRVPAAAAPLRAACVKDPAACPLYGLAIVKRDRAGAIAVWRSACDAKIGVACRFLADTFDPDMRSGDDAYVALVLGGSKPGFGDCGCDGDTRAPADPHWAENEQRRLDEAQRLVRLGCEAGDARSCEDTLGPDRYEQPPGAVVRVPAWE
jgi:TPR repeat protein